MDTISMTKVDENEATVVSDVWYSDVVEHVDFARISGKMKNSPSLPFETVYVLSSSTQKSLYTCLSAHKVVVQHSSINAKSRCTFCLTVQKSRW
mmetsp:Transcript_27607/g.67150  ORF Transcript_27607/g.67150 Transcript_27607/m.67150 type:complete len:94 (+) Transcript_27607:56-337(+)